MGAVPGREDATAIRDSPHFEAMSLGALELVYRRLEEVGAEDGPE